MTTATAPFTVGMRVRLNDTGRAVSPRLAKREPIGTVLRVNANVTVVLWDGFSGTQYWRADCLRLA